MHCPPRGHDVAHHERGILNTPFALNPLISGAVEVLPATLKLMNELLTRDTWGS